LFLVEVAAYDIFAWYSTDAPEGCYGIMNADGSLPFITLDQEKPRLVALELGQSTRTDIALIAENVIASSRWLFESYKGKELGCVDILSVDRKLDENLTHLG